MEVDDPLEAEDPRDWRPSVELLSRAAVLEKERRASGASARGMRPTLETEIKDVPPQLPFAPERRLEGNERAIIEAFEAEEIAPLCLGYLEPGQDDDVVVPRSWTENALREWRLLPEETKQVLTKLRIATLRPMVACSNSDKAVSAMA